jgi:hypothetical protein
MDKLPVGGLTLRRGQVLSTASDVTQHRAVPQQVIGERDGGVVVLLVCVLPMFAECFQYMTDIPPLYLLSKVWPLLMVPAGVWALRRLDIPHRVLHIVVLCWLLAFTPLMGVVQLGNSFADAMATTVKVWSFSYIFAVTGVLALLRPSHRTLCRAIIALGVATFAIMSVLWVVVPESAYGGGDLQTKLFMTDVERGFRIYMPMYFGVMLLLYLNRSAWMRFAWWKPVGVLAGLVLMLLIYKQRTAIASVVLALVLGSVLSMKRWRIAGFAAVGLVACAGVFLLVARAGNSVALAHQLGASLTVREVSVSTAWNYLSADPERWLLGVGGTSRIGDVTLAGLFNNPMFFLADIGWLGVLFEYGAVGVLLILLVYGAGLRSALGWGRSGDPMSQAFADYIVYLLASSVVYSAVFAPGELTTTMALSYYFSRDFGLSNDDQRSVSAQKPAPSPRHKALARSLPVGASPPPPSGIASNG